MTTEKMKELLSAKDEKITIEYKSCTNEISESVYETVSSFSNRYGGWIIMGVQDGGIPVGVNRNAAKDMKRNFVSQLNNTNKMSPTLYVQVEEFEYEGKLLLWTYVPPASTVIRCSGYSGSGVKNLYKYTPIYSGGGNPELYEADVFRIAIPLTNEAVKQVEMETELAEREQLIYDMICENQKISIDEIVAKLDVTRRTVLRDVQEIKKKMFLMYDKKELLWKLKK